MNTPFLRALGFGLAAAILAGCSGFHDEYKAALSEPQPPGQFTGAWEGTWQSDASSHGGPLRAVVRRVAQDEYNVKYQAGYKCLGIPMSFEHETTLRGAFAGSTFHFEGAADLGLLPGVYRYTGYATPDDFYSTYTAKKDQGTYTLQRPGGSSRQPESGTPGEPGKPADGKAAEFKERAVKALAPVQPGPPPAPPAAPEPKEVK